MVNSQAITITTVLVACLVSVVVFLNSGSDGSSGAGIPNQSKWTVTQDGFSQTWYLDVDAGAMRVETGFETGLMEVTEFTSSATSTFEMVDLSGWSADGFCNEVSGYDGDCSALAASVKADMDAVAEEGKTGCTVADASDTFTVTKNGDSLSVGPFTVKLGADGMPASIEGDGWSATIDSIEASDVTLTGCDTRRHTAENRDNMDIFEVIGSARRAMGEASAEVVAARAAFDPYFTGFFSSSDEQAAEHGRKLNVLTQLSAWATGTNWCGPGNQQQGAPMPGSASGVGNFEWACFRHDHGSCVQEGTIPKLACKTDRDLVNYSDSQGGAWFIDAAYGVFGILGATGCVNWEGASWDWHWQSPYSCGWRGCNGGNWYRHYHAAHLAGKYGPTRYNSMYQFGYRSSPTLDPNGVSHYANKPSSLAWYGMSCPMGTTTRSIEGATETTCNC
jgi:hypothetical protein